MAVKRKAPEEDNELRWLVTYGDVVTLMMAFFVMLYAISQVDQQKFLLFVSGLETVFNNQSVSDGLLDGGEAIVGAAANEPEEGDAGIEGIQVLDGMPARDNSVPTSTVPPPPDPDPEATDNILTSRDLIQVRDALANAFTEAGFETSATMEIDTRGLVVAVATDGVLFQSGEFDLEPLGEEIVGVIGPILADFDNQILVEGHTDTVPLNKDGYTNWNLSADRALAVLDLLLLQFEIDPARLSATGYGEYRPKASNESPEGRSINRRVELVIIASPDPNAVVPVFEGGTNGG